MKPRAVKLQNVGREDLTLDEVAAFNTLENFGWSVWFIRDARGPKRLVVLKNDDKAAVLSEDGFEIDPADLKLREK